MIKTILNIVMIFTFVWFWGYLCFYIIPFPVNLIINFLILCLGFAEYCFKKT